MHTWNAPLGVLIGTAALAGGTALAVSYAISSASKSSAFHNEAVDVPTAIGGGPVSTDEQVAEPPMTHTRMLVSIDPAIDVAKTSQLQSGDFAVANASGDTLPDALSFADRMRQAAPGVTYAVVFDRAEDLGAALPKMPEGLDVVGLSRTTNVTDKSLAALADSVHATGRRLFISTDLTGPSYATLGSRADVIEIRANDEAAATRARTAIFAAGHPQLFVRLPGRASVEMK